jgi:hypothetical protein
MVTLTVIHVDSSMTLRVHAALQTSLPFYLQGLVIISEPINILNSQQLEISLTERLSVVVVSSF